MSKMSMAAMELDEQAAELGYDGLQDALNNGYSVCYDEKGFYLDKVDIESEQEKAHNAWLREKDEVLEDLGRLYEGLIERGYDALAEIAKHAMEFIEKGEL